MAQQAGTKVKNPGTKKAASPQDPDDIDLAKQVEASDPREKLRRDFVHRSLVRLGMEFSVSEEATLADMQPECLFADGPALAVKLTWGDNDFLILEQISDHSIEFTRGKTDSELPLSYGTVRISPLICYGGDEIN